MKTIDIVAHTHWDREWYFTEQDTLVLSDALFKEVITELERNKKATFCLDGQSSILSDFLHLNPQYKKRISALVKEKRLSVGPWFTQSDCLYVDGESILRNMAYGIFQTKKIGTPMNVAYLPDSFGFNAQMPTIVNHCNIENLIFRRGSDYDLNIPDTNFKWFGLNNQRYVNTTHMYEGYGTGYRMNDSQEYINQKLVPYIEKISSHTDADHILVGSGGDQTRICPDLDQIVSKINKKLTDYKLEISTYDQYFKAQKAYFKEKYIGELREGRYDRVHKTIGGIRYDIKYNNYLVEKKLLNRVEPLIYIGSKFNIEVSTQLLYNAWELLMRGQAHDSMGGCVTDNVAKQILDRFSLADEIADGIENLIVYKISEKLQLSDNQIVIFNTDSSDFLGLKNISFISKETDVKIADHSFTITQIDNFEGKDNLLIENPEGNVYVNEDPYFKISGVVECSIPSMGYKVFDIINEPATKLNSVGANYIKNNFYELKYENELVLKILKTGEEITNFISFEDCGNDGDTYDFSPLKEDKAIFFSPQLETVYSSDTIKVMNLSANVKLPFDLESRGGGLTKEFSLSLAITLTQNEEINVKIVCDNNILSHRLRANIKSCITTDKSISSVPFGFIDRKILNGKYPDWSTHNEFPVDIHPVDELCALSNKSTCYVLTRGIKEYQAQEDYLKLTLLATTSQLGKPNLIYRPGRASGDTTKKGHVMIETPLAEQLGINNFEFNIIYSSDPFDEAYATNLINSFQNRDIYYQRQNLNKFINRLDNKIFASPLEKKYESLSNSFLKVQPGLTLSSISPSLYTEGKYVLRIKNQTSKTIELNEVVNVEHTFINAIEELVEPVDEVNKYDFINLLV